MSRKKAAKATPEYVPSVENACNETTLRLNVVIRMLQDHDCDDARDNSAASCGGFDLSVMRDELERMRDVLNMSLESEAKAGKTTAGAR